MSDRLVIEEHDSIQFYAGDRVADIYSFAGMLRIELFDEDGRETIVKLTPEEARKLRDLLIREFPE